MLFKNLSFTLKQGQILYLTGPNGCGKSTLLRVLAGLAAPARGRINYFYCRKAYNAGKMCHYLSNQNAMKESLTILENLTFWSKFYGINKEKRTLETLLQRFGLLSLKDFPFSQLSTGQRRRLGLARLLLKPCPFWLMDEPSAGLDQDFLRLFYEIIEEGLNQKKTAIIIATPFASFLPAAKELNLTPYCA